MKFESPSFYTGTLFEEETLGGRCSGDWDEKMNWDFDLGKKFAIDHQPAGWNPSDPGSRLANDLHALVAEKLDLDDLSELKLYSALGTPLDRYYGVDAFFEYHDQICTLDLTLKKEKREYKADYVWHPEDKLELLAKFIARDLGKTAEQVAA